MRVCFDIRGTDAESIEATAESQLLAFIGEGAREDWTMTIEVEQEVVGQSGETISWRGDVTAEREDG